MNDRSKMAARSRSLRKSNPTIVSRMSCTASLLCACPAAPAGVFAAGHGSTLVTYDTLAAHMIEVCCFVAQGQLPGLDRLVVCNAMFCTSIMLV
jgi:hypothetical protein